MSIDPLLDGANSQGLAGLAFDIVTDTGVVQSPLVFAETSTDLYPATVVDPVWIGAMTPTLVGGFGMGFISSGGATSVQVGSVLGAGVFMPLVWDADVSSAAGLQPDALHNVGFGAPPGTDVGGATVPASDERSRWYVLAGEIAVPDDPGVYTVSVNPRSVLLIKKTLDLAEDVTDGYVIDAVDNGDAVAVDYFTFEVIAE